MANLTLLELYLGDKYNIMGNATKDFLLNGSPDKEEQTGIELLIVKHTILTVEKMKKEDDYISDLTSVL